ncbi:AMP-binding protein [Streptomyces sp. URMC 123]|uniref:AMP-binding protein n=1 Tax=Streptomyces sp. URMC 123 TaxID=3423403 RepID=UPI003F1AB665
MARSVRGALALPTAPALAARRHGRVPILLDTPLDLFPEAGPALDYVRLAELVESAARLLAGAGIGPGSRVMVVKRPSFDVPLLAFACARIGAVPVLVHPGVGRRSLPVLVERARPEAIVTDACADSVAALADLPAGGPPRWSVGAAAVPGARALRGVRAAVGLPPAAVPFRQAPQLVTHTSGTTGVPKLVLQSAATFAGQCGPQAVIGRLLRARDPYLVCLSPVHVRTVAAVVATLALGVPLGFLTDPAPANAARMLGLVRPGFVETVPNAFIRWEEIADGRPDLLASVRMFLSTFDAAHPRTVRTLLAAGRPGARYVQIYGQSETGPVAMRFHRRAAGLLARRGGACANGRCVGRPIPGHSRVRIGGADGAPRAPRGTPGPILAKSWATTPRYLGTPDQRVDGWWAMGDFGALSARGCLHLYDRIADREPGVESLLALEDTLLDRAPRLTEAVLVPMPGGPPVPLVCTRGDVPLEEGLWRAAVAGLPPLAPPVQCRWDDIPHTATWKVKRAEAAERLASGRLMSITAGGPGGPQGAGPLRTDRKGPS